MKQLLIFLGIAAAGSASGKGLVADSFDCELKFESSSELPSFVTQTDDVHAGRTSISLPNMPVEDPPRDIRVTKGKLSLRTNHGGLNYGVQLNPWYLHAVEYDSQGVPFRAAQYTCTEGGAWVPGESSRVSVCIAPSGDPFDPANPYWKLVGIFESGIAKFDNRWLKPLVGSFAVGSFEALCSHNMIIH